VLTDREIHRERPADRERQREREIQTEGGTKQCRQAEGAKR